MSKVNVTLQLEVTTNQFNNTWQAWYGSDEGKLLVFQCATEQEAVELLSIYLVEVLNNLGAPEPLC